MLVEFLLTGLFIFLAWLPFKKPSGYPPGYWGFPLIGYIPIRKDFEHVLSGLHLKFGKIVCWRIGTRLIISINDFELSKEALTGANFLDRPDFFSGVHSLFRGENLGLVGSNGLQWVNGRRFALRHLRNFGMGKSKLTSTVQQQALHLVDELKKQDGKASPISHSLQIAVINVIWSMVASKEYAFDDPEINTFCKMVADFMHQLSSTVAPYFFPWSVNIMPNFLLRKIIRQDFLDKFTAKFIGYFNDIIDEHENNVNEIDPKDYIEAYLAEMKNTMNDEYSTLSKKDLIANIHDLFIAGSESTTTMLQWAFFYMAAYPDTQKRLQQELDEALPNSTLITLEDRGRVPHLESFLCELHRHVSMAVIGGFHLATHDSKLGSYLIPKGTCVVAFCGGSHYNRSYWKDPQEFNYVRFLDTEGKFIPPKQGWMPFGVGKRQCLGESLARMELLVFVATILQRFSIAPPTGKEMDLTPDKGNPFFRLPQVQLDIVFTSR